MAAPALTIRAKSETPTEPTNTTDNTKRATRSLESVKPEPPSDDALVEAIRGGDEAAFEALYNRYFKRVYHFIRNRLSNIADTEETTQEVFINVFSSIDSFRGEAPLAAWIFGITRRTIAARFKRKRHPTVPLADEGDAMSAQIPASEAPSPLENCEYQEYVDQLTHTLEQKLSPEQRMLFELHHLQERSIEDIALEVGKSHDAVKSNLYRARRVLLAGR